MIAKAKIPSTATPRTIAHGTFLGASLTSSPVKMSVRNPEACYSVLTHMDYTIKAYSLSAESKKSFAKLTGKCERSR